MTLLSVIVAAKDVESHMVRCCLGSFGRLKNAPGIEVVIVNSGILPHGYQEFEQAFSRLHVVEMPPDGVYAAYNRGIAEACGRYLLFFGMDDIALPGMDTIIDALKSESATYDLYAASAYMQGTGMSRPARWAPSILFRNWCHQALFYSREYLRNRVFDTQYPMQADHKMNIEILSDGERSVGKSQELVSYFSNGGISQSKFDLAFRRDLPALAGQHFGSFFRLAVVGKQYLSNLIRGAPEARTLSGSTKQSGS